MPTGASRRGLVVPAAYNAIPGFVLGPGGLFAVI
jgi:hypothetical protein